MTKAIVPVKHQDNLTFVSHGTVTGLYCSPDIKAMRLDGWNVEVKWGFVWSEKTDVLRAVYSRLYEERKSYNKDHPLNYCRKIIMNSSYSKFCQKQCSIDSRPKYIGWFCLAYSRLQLFHLMNLSKDKPVLYGDTDSIYVSASVLPLNETVCRNELSYNEDDISVDVEGCFDEMTVISKKTYGVINRESNVVVVKAKGIPKAKYSDLVRSLYDYTSVNYLAKGHSAISNNAGYLTINTGNLKDSKRLLKVHIPNDMYKCTECSLLHSMEINMS